MSFGCSPSDIIRLIEISHSVVENCRGGATSAANGINNLRHTVAQFEALLRQFQRVLVETGEVSCFEFHGIELTLKECQEHLKKYAALEKWNSARAEPQGHKLRVKASREILAKSINAAKVGTDIARHIAWGEKDAEVLQHRIMRHKQSLALYLNVLERERTTQMGERLRSMEQMVKEMHTETMSKPHPKLLNRVSTAPPPIDTTVPHGSDRYQTILETVERQREFAKMQRNVAGNGEEDWEAICDQLDLFHQRVLNVIERKVNASAQLSDSSSPSHIELNRALLSRNRVGDVFPKPISRASTFDSGFCEDMSRPLTPLGEENGSLFEGDSVDSPVDLTPPLTPNISPQSHWSGIGKGLEKVDLQAMDPHLTPTISQPNPSCFASEQKDREPQLSSASRPVLSCQATSPRRQGSESSDSTITMTTWKRIRLRGWLKVACDSQPPRYCSLEAGYSGSARMHAIKAVDQEDTGRQLPILKFASKQKRPIPHAEPPGLRDNPEEGHRIYFVKPPPTEGGEGGVQYLFGDENDHLKFQSLIYGQKLLLAMVVQKISSTLGKESDRQYLRVWESQAQAQNHGRSLLYFASARPHPTYIEIPNTDITPGFKKPRRGNTLDLKVLGGPRHLKVMFNNREDLEKFVEVFLAKAGG